MPKEVVVIGGGCVGTFLSAALLSCSTENVPNLTIVENNLDRFEEIRSFGVGYRIGSSDVEEHYIPPDKFSLKQSMSMLASAPDVVFIAIKSYQLTPEFYLNEVAPFLHERSKVVLVQNGYPQREILEVVGEKAVIFVVGASFKLGDDGRSAISNKSQIDLPYGSLMGLMNRVELEDSIGHLFIGSPRGIEVRYSDNIPADVLKKAQYACVGAYCAVEAFKSRHPRDIKFTFGNLMSSEREVVGDFTRAISTKEISQKEKNILDISDEIEMVAGFPLLSHPEMWERIKINSDIENSLVTDARSGRDMEIGVVDNLIILARARGLETPKLDDLSRALHLIEVDKWSLEDFNVRELKNIYPERPVAQSII